MTSIALEISQSLAFDRLIDGLYDGALYADALFRTASGPPNRLTISPANWLMHKYNGAQLHYDFIEIATVDLILWLRLDKRQDAALQEALASGALTTIHDAALIRRCIQAVYVAAAAQSVKPPNINELPECVNKLLARQSVRALHDQIKAIGQEPDFAALRPSQGRRSSASQRPLSELDFSVIAPLQ